MFQKMLFRTAAAFLAAVLLILHANASQSVSARSCIVMDADSGRVLYEKNADEQALIASTTKIMTAIVVLEHLPIDRVVTIPPEATGIEGSSMYLKPNETLTVEALLYGMMLHSGNDAAVALALICAGSVPEFAALMNIKAQKLGLMQTHFENPSGLDSQEHHSSARDLALLTAYALKNETFLQIVSTKTICIGERSLTNHNKLLWMQDGCIGVKTGYTKAAGRILVSAAQKDGRTLIVVTICDGNDWQDHMWLYDACFSKYSVRTLLEKDQTVAELLLMNGEKVKLLAGESLSYSALSEENAEVVVSYPAIAFERGENGTLAGIGSVYLGTKKIATIPLLWGG